MGNRLSSVEAAGVDHAPSGASIENPCGEDAPIALGEKMSVDVEATAGGAVACAVTVCAAAPCCTTCRRRRAPPPRPLEALPVGNMREAAASLLVHLL